MSKIWVRTMGATTHAHNLDTKKHANFFLGAETCQSMAGEFPKTRLELESSKEPVDFFEVGPLFIVSDGLREVLESSQAKAEFFPVTILRGKKKYTTKPFFACNIMDCVECFDYDRGKYTFWESGRVNAIKRIAIDESKAAGHQLFHIANGGEYIVCASDDLADRVKEGGFSGVSFVTAAKWRFGM